MENQKFPLSMYSAEVQKMETIQKTVIYSYIFISIHGLATEILIESINCRLQTMDKRALPTTDKRALPTNIEPNI